MSSNHDSAPTRLPFVERLLVGSAILFLAFVSFSCDTPPSDTLPDRSALIAEIEDALKTGLFERWYPLAVDTVYGGFLTTFDYRFEPVEPQNKMIVTQARHVWSTAKASQFYPDDPRYLPASAYGFAFLRDVMWDKEHGGFFDTVTREGEVMRGRNGSIRKLAYGNAFAIYGLSAYYRASGDTAALDLAREAFMWLENHSHDPVYGGYYQFMVADGSVIREGYGMETPKDQNSSIHLLEAFTELYQVWPDDLVRDRLNEMLVIVRDTITTDKGYLTLFFKPDWTPISYRDSSEAARTAHYAIDHVSFGHDVETAFLMLEASHVLGLENDTTTLRIAKKMVDHALKYGWDEEVGGFYDRGYYFAGDDELTIIADSKNWWAQAEGLNTLLLMAELFPEDEMRYEEKFLKQWEYIKTYLLDHEHGGWYEGGLDKEPEWKTRNKGHIWKGSYHTARSLMNVLSRLDPSTFGGRLEGGHKSSAVNS